MLASICIFNVRNFLNSHATYFFFVSGYIPQHISSNTLNLESPFRVWNQISRPRK